MLRVSFFLLAAVIFIAAPLIAQDFFDCADVNEDGVFGFADVITMADVHLGGAPIPEGRGDVDFRAGINLGDSRFMCGFIFMSYPEGGCPPFDPYPLITSTADTLYLPSFDVPAGNGEFSMPIVLVNHHSVTDLLVSFQIETLGGTVYLDSIQTGPLMYPQLQYDDVQGDYGVMGFQSISNAIDPGTRILGQVHCHYSDCPGGAVLVSAGTPRPETFTHYVYGDLYSSYEYLTIAIPTIVAGSGIEFPSMTVSPSTLTFVTFAGYPDPDPQQVTVLSDGEPFGWLILSAPDWISTDITQGTSGEPVNVTPNIAGMYPGTYSGDVWFSSFEALNTPQKATVELTLKRQYPALDANCDGIYNIADVVVQINYIFGGGSIPCDPCTGEPTPKK
jgi:hypothetical protein